MQSWTRLPYTMSQQLYGDYAVYSYSDARNDSRMLMATGSVSKTLDFMREAATSTVLSTATGRTCSRSRRLSTR